MSKDYFGGLNVVDEEERAHRRCYARRIMLATLIGSFVAAFLLYGAKKAYADPMAKVIANGGQVVITVYTEDCARKDVVTNLPKRATWAEDGKTYEGCVGIQPEAGVAMFWFDDRTVAIVPLQAFVRVVGA